jgi:chromate reductase, NAD(P)H dehydrogenase (quinone)
MTPLLCVAETEIRPDPEPLRLLVFAGVLRAGSYNKQLARIAAARLAARGIQIDHADFREFDMPLFDQDVQDTLGFPAGMLELNRRLKAADGFVIVSAEYNFSIPGLLKNAIDWSSRERPIPWKNKPGLLMGASPSTIGAQRCLWALRVPLEALGACLYPDMFSLAQADRKLDANGELTDEQLSSRLDTVLDRFLAFARAVGTIARRT